MIGFDNQSYLEINAEQIWKKKWQWFPKNYFKEYIPPIIDLDNLYTVRKPRAQRTIPENLVQIGSAIAEKNFQGLFLRGFATCLYNKIDMFD